MSPELDTLDQLLGGRMRLGVVRKIFPDQNSFLRGVHGILVDGDAHLLNCDGTEVPQWGWRDLFDERCATHDLDEYWLELTSRGADRIG